MNRRLPFLIPALLGLAAIAFGEADDAPGLVMFGLFLIVGSAAFVAVPALRTRSRVVGFIIAAIALTAIGSGVAGWLENNY
jgi:hypothetical protein